MPVLYQTPEFVIASSGPVLLSVWHAAATNAWFDIYELHHAKFAAEFPRFYVASVIATIDTSPTGTEIAKRRGLALAAQYEPKTIATATVILPGGVAGSVARGFVTTFNRIRASKVPSKVFATVEECIFWFDSLKARPALLPNTSDELLPCLTAGKPVKLRTAHSTPGRTLHEPARGHLGTNSSL